MPNGNQNGNGDKTSAGPNLGNSGMKLPSSTTPMPGISGIPLSGGSAGQGGQTVGDLADRLGSAPIKKP